MDDESGDDSAPGWDAITAAFDVVYPGQEPRHWAATSKLPGDDGIDGLSAYWTGSHWHFVTLGLTELWFKESDDPAVSGFGFEFTMRTPGDADGGPPAWAIRLLQKCADAMFNGAGFASGHTLDPGGSISGNDDSNLRAILFTDDAQLERLATPHGSVEFVQVVGITLGELDQIKHDRDASLERLRNADPLLVTDPTRAG